MSGSSVYDSLRLNESMSGPEVPDFVARDRQFIDIYDGQNNQYTSGQITFDCNALCSSASFVDWKSSYMTIPLQITGTVSNPSSGTVTQPGTYEKQFALGLKNSGYSIINSLNISCANQSVVTAQQMSNIPITYKLLTTWDRTDVDTYGPSLLFGKDTSDSLTWDTHLGEINNNVSVSNQSITTGAFNPVNVGRQQRLYQGTITDINPLFALVGGATLENTQQTQAARSVVTTSSTSTITVALHAQIPMRYLHDLFDKMPLCRGALWNIAVNTHCPSSFTFTFTNASPSVITAPLPTNLNGFTPFMISPVSATAGGGITVGGTFTATTGTATYTVNCGIGNSITQGCVLHCAMFDLSPTAGAAYIANPQKTVVYQDFIRATPAGMSSVGPNQPVRSNVTAGLGKLRGMLIFPSLPTGYNGDLGVSALNSPFTSCGATTAPLAYFQNFNVAISGQNIYSRNIRYRYDHFLREQFGCMAPNGNGVDSLRAGLINEFDFNMAYGYVWVNLERHPESSDSLPASVDVEFNNGTGTNMSYNVFLFYEKQFTIDILTGKMIV